MNAILSLITFQTPWLLIGLLSLPALWYLLRLTPPPPRIINFPATRFLSGLIPDEQTPQKTPWWILFLRLLILALVITGLAGPMTKPQAGAATDKNIRIIIDNSWAGAQNWGTMMNAAEGLINQARLSRQKIMIATTAPKAGQDQVLYTNLVTPGEALSVVKGLAPHPWPASYKALADAMSEQDINAPADTIWLSHGLDESAENDVSLGDIIGSLRNQGTVRFISPDAKTSAKLIRVEPRGQDFEIIISRGDQDNTPTIVQAITQSGGVLDQITLRETDSAAFTMPPALRNQLYGFRIAGGDTAGSLYTLGGAAQKKTIGIFSTKDLSTVKPYIEHIFYLTRALEPYGHLHHDDIPSILAENPDLIILPDVPALPPAQLEALEAWVSDGGLLLRFAGPNMAQSREQTFLTPVLLRQKARATGGTLSWEDSPKLEVFHDNTPLAGLPVSGEIRVQRQILPAAEEDNENKIWASLNDGTPFITADHFGRGLLIMIHTTASPAWSDFALSGSYISVLTRIVELSGRPHDIQIQGDQTLQPVWYYDGFGRIRDAESWIKPARMGQADIKISSQLPPGLYGNPAFQRFINLGDHIEEPAALDNLPSGVIKQTYGTAGHAVSLLPYFLAAAIFLFLLDWLITMALSSRIGSAFRRNPAVLAFVCVLLTSPAQAQDPTAYANNLYLAYIKSGNPTLDKLAESGLNNLRDILEARTSAEPKGVVGLNPETDTLAFFPLIYWPVPETASLSEQAARNLQSYIDQGGMLFIDTRDGRDGGTQNLRDLLSQLTIPALQPLVSEHVIGKSFYLLDRFPGRYTGRTIWVQNPGDLATGAVSPVIIGSHDWLTAWATDREAAGIMPGGTRQREMAYRFGVNLMIYALTGNYKADQVHIPYILERLDR